MDANESVIVRADGWLWHLSNVTVGVAVFVATVLYAPPGTYSVDLVITSVDPFYLVAPLSLLYTCWCGLEMWRWYQSDEIL